ncbi:MAG: 16S rRNA (cytidine(1402)-2'-O)-methyltransferase [Christensenellales bacterium]|nr:16S rRNA (cytidine(1402)-2'-O)-methyltransferase [Christensenellales bacterium]
MAKLYVVATPIGNLNDITPRALETLKSVDLIAAEDTRVTRALLNHFGVDTPCISNHQHNEEHRAASLPQRMLDEDLSVAVVTDAGTPCISDPGSVLVREAAALGVEVLAVPGPTAMASALSVSGMDTREFAFYGFLPRQKKELREKLLSMKRSGTPIGVVHESPHRVIELVRTIAQTLPGCRISASCDLTKLHEKTIRGTAEEVLSMLEANEKAEKGEYCLVLDMSDVALPEEREQTSASLEAQLLEEMLSGFDLRQAAMTLTERGYKRNDVYRARTNVQRFLDDQMADYAFEEEDETDE